MDPFKDEEGIILAGDLAAREHAIQIVNELQKGDEESWRGYVMEVMREGSVVWVIPSTGLLARKMVSTVMRIQQSLMVCAAALVVSTSSSYAGPCSKKIARLRAEMERRAPEHRSKEAMAAMDRASAADRTFDKTACEAAISDAWQAFRK